VFVDPSGLCGNTKTQYGNLISNWYQGGSARPSDWQLKTAIFQDAGYSSIASKALSVLVNVTQTSRLMDGWSGMEISTGRPLDTGERWAGGFVGGVGITTTVASAVGTTGSMMRSSRPSAVVQEPHGNSLQSTRLNYGYRLENMNTGATLKYGETAYPATRYTQKYLNENNARMDIRTQGSKLEMHNWQHERIIEYTEINGVRPPLNKSDW
jgi:hypothetical protein